MELWIHCFPFLLSLIFLAVLVKKNFNLLGSIYRVLFRSGFSCMVSIWENSIVWSPGSCCKTLRSHSSTTRCSSGGNFSCWWLSSSLARCLCWRVLRFVHCWVVHLLLNIFSDAFQWLILTLKSISSAGFTVASFCYFHFFPPPYDPHGMFHSIMLFLVCEINFLLCGILLFCHQ